MTQTTTFDIDTATAAATAEAVRHGKISALEVCDAAIARIERRDGPINAVVVRDFDRARAAAKAIDAARKAGDTRPLLGVPMTIKESNDIAGLPSTWGFPEFKDKPVQRDGTVAARLQAAGAVLLGKSNVPVALGDWQTSNPIYGRTVNPHDHARSPGGSSGGGAAALAAGMVPLEVGSDIGGSIRVPAHMCGVFGLKPSYGIIPLKGHGFPGMDGAEVALAVVGPLARSADDLALALDVLAGPLDGSGYRLDLPAPRHRKLGEFRVLMLDTHPLSATDASVREPLHKLTHDLERAGVKILRNVANLPDLAEAGRGYGNMLRTLTSRGAPGVTPIDAHAYLTLLDEQARLIRRWAEIFKEIDVVISPPFGLPAFPHDDNPNWQERTHVIDGVATPYGTQFGWAGLATFPNLPAAVAPIAKTKDGLPVGVQIMAGAFEDRTAIAFASLLEREGLARYERP